MTNDPIYDGLPRLIDGALKVYTINNQIHSQEIMDGWTLYAARLLERSQNEIISLREQLKKRDQPTKGDNY